MAPSLTASPSSNRTLLNALSKVPEVTLFFWIIKVLCTTVGETASDFLNVNLNFGLTGTSVVVGIILAVVLVVQFTTKKYTPVVYWLTVVLISIFGTLVTDTLTDTLAVPLEYSTVVFSVLLAGVFGLWYFVERTLSIHSIVTRRREVFYWLAILTTFALGTAAGDLMAESLGLGYATTGLIVIGLIAAFSIGWRLGLNAILSFWFIYIMTRPLGASLGDFLSQSPAHGGIGLGATLTSVIFGIGIVATVLYLALTKKDRVTDAEKEVVADESQSKNGLLQLVIVTVLLLAFSLGGYTWRHQHIQPPASTQEAQTATSTASTQPLGDLSSFTVIAQSMRDNSASGDFAGVNAGADNLEYSWDTAEATLRPRDAKAWGTVDTAVDHVLRQARAVRPDQQQQLATLDALLSALQQP